jgi:uncharacterized membrane protein YgcG
MRTTVRHASVWLFVAGCARDLPATHGRETALSHSPESAFNYFVSRGLTEEQSAGIVGNLMQESNLNPDTVQLGGGPGRGIAQWSVGGRWDTTLYDNVTWFACTNGVSPWAFQTQLDFIWYELETFSEYGLTELRNAVTVRDATIVFQDRFEQCGRCNQETRVAAAEQVFRDYAGGGTPGDAGGSGGGGGSGGSGGSPDGGGSGDGGNDGGGGTGCYAVTLGREVPANACVQSQFDHAWYQCDNGTWVDRWTDPEACNGVYPL